MISTACCSCSSSTCSPGSVCGESTIWVPPSRSRASSGAHWARPSCTPYASSPPMVISTRKSAASATRARRTGWEAAIRGDQSVSLVGGLLPGCWGEHLLDGDQQEVSAVAVGEFQGDPLGFLVAGDDRAHQDRKSVV